MGKYKARFGDHYSYHMGGAREGTKQEILRHIRETLMLRMGREPKLKTWVDNEKVTWVWEHSVFKEDDTGAMAVCVIEKKRKEV